MDRVRCENSSPATTCIARGTQMKRRTCQTYRRTLPEWPAEARHQTGLRSSPRRHEACARRHHSWARGIDSSARLESVAHVENTVMDVYYRNDSMKSERGSLSVGLLGLHSMGWIWYSQSRVTRSSRIAKSKIFIDAQSTPSLFAEFARG